MQTFLIFGFFFLFASMFFVRIALNFGFKLPREFIGVQITLAIIVIFLHLAAIHSFATAFLFIGVSSAIGFLMEMVGLKTRIIFGKYVYTDKAGPKMFGHVPIFIPLMWCVITYMAFSMARLILSTAQLDTTTCNLFFILLASALTTLWDVVADPLAVAAGGWTWEKGGNYYGVPISNFAGWLVTSVLIFTTISTLYDPIQTAVVATWLEYLPALGYCVITAVFARACLERRMLLPAIIGFVMAGFCFICWCYRIL